MTQLEQSFVDLCAKHDLTAIIIGMNLKQIEKYRFDAGVHWEGYARGGIPYAQANAATLDEALNLALTKAHTDRKRPLTTESLPDEALEQAA